MFFGMNPGLDPSQMTPEQLAQYQYQMERLRALSGVDDHDGDLIPDDQQANYLQEQHSKNPESFYRGPDGKMHDLSGRLGNGIQPKQYGDAFADPNSGISNISYFGGSRDAAAKQYGRQIGMANELEAREGIAANWDNARSSEALQGQGTSGLVRAAAGDPNTAAQRDLKDGFARSSALMQGQAAGARGGLAARSLAGRTAANQIASNVGAQRIASADLMTQERMAAIPQLAQAANARRGQAESIAGTTAQLDQQNWQQNQDAAFDARARGMRTAGLGMQGEMHRQGARRDAAAGAAGISLAADVSRRQAEGQMINTGLGFGGGLLQAGGSLMNKGRAQDAASHGTSGSSIIRRNPY